MNLSPGPHLSPDSEPTDDRDAAISELTPSPAQDILEFDVRTLLGEELPGGVHGSITVPSFAFIPSDSWGQVLRAGLRGANLSGQVYEVGVGTGINVIDALAHHPSIERIWGSDLDSKVIALAADNVRAISGIAHEKFEPLLGSSDLLSSFKEKIGRNARLDAIFACIPQVRLPATGSTLPDQLAHYYSGAVPDGFEDLDHYDLTLNGRLLLEATDHLTPGKGRIILNLAGRVPLDILEGMFTQTGYAPRVIHTAVIPQHKDTRLDDFVTQERDLGIRFEFFGDAECMGTPLTAADAQRRIDDGNRVYHRMYVIEGRYHGIA